MPDETSYDAGRLAALAGKDRASPYDGRSTAGKDWLRGYDSVDLDPPTPGPEPAPASPPPPPPPPPPPTASTVAPPSVPAGALVPAGESSDPDVQYQLANRRAHELVLADPESSQASREDAERSIAGIDRSLREMGYR